MAERQEFLCVFGNVINRRNGVKMAAPGYGFPVGLAVPFQQLYKGFALEVVPPAAGEMAVAELVIEETVEEEISQRR